MPRPKDSKDEQPRKSRRSAGRARMRSQGTSGPRARVRRPGPFRADARVCVRSTSPPHPPANRRWRPRTDFLWQRSARAGARCARQEEDGGGEQASGNAASPHPDALREVRPPAQQPASSSAAAAPSPSAPPGSQPPDQRPVPASPRPTMQSRLHRLDGRTHARTRSCLSLARSHVPPALAFPPPLPLLRSFAKGSLFPCAYAHSRVPPRVPSCTAGHTAG